MDNNFAYHAFQNNALTGWIMINMYVNLSHNSEYACNIANLPEMSLCEISTF